MNSFAIGANAGATGPYSIALGQFAHAVGTGSFAASTGYSSGNYAFSIGENVDATATASAAFGLSNNANSEASFVIGAYNVGKTKSNGTPTTSSWVSGDPLFEIGNGTSSTPADAVVVYKDGSAKFSGAVAFVSPVTVPQSGDHPDVYG